MRAPPTSEIGAQNVGVPICRSGACRRVGTTESTLAGGARVDPMKFQRVLIASM